MDIKLLKDAINSFESLDARDELAYEQVFLVFNVLKNVPFFVNTMKNTFNVYRTRTHQNPELISNISELSCPQRNYVNAFARCNRPHQSIFYCSENRPTSYMELIEYWAETKKFGDELCVTVTNWEVTTPLNLVVITSPDPNDRLSQYDKIHGEAYDKFIKDKSKEEVNYINMFFEYLFEKFRKPAKNDLKTYLITSAYTNMALLFGNETVDGVSYPSVPYNGEGINFALNKNVVSRKLALKSALYSKFKISENAEKKHHFFEVESKYTDNIDINKNTLIWE